MASGPSGRFFCFRAPACGINANCSLVLEGSHLRFYTSRASELRFPSGLGTTVHGSHRLGTWRNWLARRLVTPKVAGSSPVVLAFSLRAAFSGGPESFLATALPAPLQMHLCLQAK